VSHANSIDATLALLDPHLNLFTSDRMPPRPSSPGARC
jgi:hypothetical protein